MKPGGEWDAFISHAFEDKVDIARPLANALSSAGLSVWYDEFTLSAGDSLTASVDEGLANSKFGIVIISPAFLAKKWPQRELAGLFVKEHQAKVVIPIWHNVDRAEVATFSPILADRIALRSTSPMDEIVKELLRAMNLPFRGPELTGSWFGASGRLRLFNVGEMIEGDYDWNGQDWGAHLRGRLTGTVFSFEWWWDFTAERGGGFFMHRENALDGEWWLGQRPMGDPVRRNESSETRTWNFKRAVVDGG